MARVMASLVAGVTALRWPGLTVVVMVILSGVRAMVIGVLLVALAFRSRPLQA